MEFYSYKKRGRKRFSHAEGGGAQKSVEVVLTHKLDILAIVMGGRGAKQFPPFQKGGSKSLNNIIWRSYKVVHHYEKGIKKP